MQGKLDSRGLKARNLIGCKYLHERSKVDKLRESMDLRLRTLETVYYQ